MRQPPQTTQDKRNLAQNSLSVFWHFLTVGRVGSANRAVETYDKMKRETNDKPTDSE